MQLRYPVFDATVIVDFANAKLTDVDQHVLGQSMKMSRSGIVYTFDFGIYPNKKILSFDDVTSDERSNLIGFFYNYIGEWVRVVTHDSRHFKMMVLNTVIEFGQETINFQGFNLELLNNTEIIEILTNSFAFSQNTQTSTPVSYSGLLIDIGQDSATSLIDPFIYTIIAVSQNTETSGSQEQLKVTIAMSQTTSATIAIAAITISVLLIQQVWTDTPELITTDEFAAITTELIVSTSGNPDEYSSLYDAVAAAETLGIGKIRIKPGTYTEDTQIDVPDIDLEIYGESGVLLQTATTAVDLFYFDSYTGIFKIRDLTIEAMSTTFDHVFYGIINNTGIIEVNNIVINLHVDCVSTADTNYGMFFHSNTFEKIIVTKTTINNGYIGIHLSSLSGTTVRIDNCIFNDIKNKSISISTTTGVEVFDNIIKDFTGMAVYVSGTLSDIKILRNQISGLSTSTVATRGIYVTGDNIDISNNQISIITATIEYWIQAIAVNYIDNGVISNNIVNIIDTETTHTTFAKGIFIGYSENNVIIGNQITIDNDNCTVDSIGIHLYGASLNNSVSKNVINMVNGDAEDIGIQIETAATGNEYTDNLILNAGDDIYP